MSLLTTLTIATRRGKMGVSLLEALEGAGFSPLSTTEDAEWLLSTQNEYEELIEQAEELLEEE